MRAFVGIIWVAVIMFPAVASAQTADEVAELIQRLVDLDSVDVAKEVKFRAGIEPPLFAADADESAAKVLANPFEVQGRNQPGAAGWYRVTFTVPEKIGKFAVPPEGYKLGVESNVLGSWEIYGYHNGRPVGSAAASGVAGTWNQGNMLWNTRQHASAWMSNAPIPAKPRDKVTLAILATAAPLGRGSPEGFGLRLLRLRFAQAHTFARQPFFGSVTAPGVGSGLHGAREMLATRKGEDLAKLQARLKGPLSRLDALFAAAETGQLDNLTKAMRTATMEINEALKSN
jgi:hypothetical protein